MRKPVLIALAAILCFAAGVFGFRTFQRKSSHQVTLHWQAPASEQDSALLRYNIYRSEDARSYPLLAGRVPGATYVDRAVKSGRTYRYVVSTLDARGRESARSAEISVKVP